MNNWSEAASSSEKKLNYVGAKTKVAKYEICTGTKDKLSKFRLAILVVWNERNCHFQKGNNQFPKMISFPRNRKFWQFTSPHTKKTLENRVFEINYWDELPSSNSRCESLWRLPEPLFLSGLRMSDVDCLGVWCVLRDKPIEEAEAMVGRGSRGACSSRRVFARRRPPEVRN